MPAPKRSNLVVVATLAMLCALFPWRAADAVWMSGDEAIMGTAIHVELWHDDAAVAEQAVAAVMAEMHRIDATMSTWKDDSDLSRLNRLAPKEPVTVSPEMMALFRESARISALTDGAFDITYASIGRLYDYRAAVKPGKAEIDAILEAVNWRNVVLDEAERTVRFADPRVYVDFGGIAKGYAVEQGAQILRSMGIEHAIVTAGGDSRIVGDRRGKPWIVGIRDPRSDGAIVARLPLVDEAISTSGDYERYFEADGERYHHILSPQTGRSAGAVRSSTIVGPNATTTDALSTSVFVLGPAAGMALIEKLDGIEAVIVDAEGVLHYSSGFQSPATPD